MSTKFSQSKRSRLADMMIGLLLSSFLFAFTASLWRVAQKDFDAIGKYAQQSSESHRRNLRLAGHGVSAETAVRASVPQPRLGH